jgi:lipopolysaccharide transport protein LptA
MLIGNNKNKFVTAVFIFIIGYSSSLLALAGDEKEKPGTKLVSNSAVCKSQDEGNICSYLGNAVLTQGATKLQAQQITVYREINGKISKIVASGKHSRYSSIMGKEKKIINASANLIIIYPDKNMLILEGNGNIISGQDKYSAPHIEYQFG